MAEVHGEKYRYANSEYRAICAMRVSLLMHCVGEKRGVTWVLGMGERREVNVVPGIIYSFVRRVALSSLMPTCS